jgi:hypothetical protein
MHNWVQKPDLTRSPLGKCCGGICTPAKPSTQLPDSFQVQQSQSIQRQWYLSTYLSLSLRDSQPLWDASESDAEMGGNSGEDDQYEIEDKEEEIPNMSRHSDKFKTCVAEALATLDHGAPAATVPPQ